MGTGLLVFCFLTNSNTALHSWACLLVYLCSKPLSVPLASLDILFFFYGHLGLTILAFLWPSFQG